MGYLLLTTMFFGCDAQSKSTDDSAAIIEACEPVAPCDVDFDVVCGTVIPDLGSVASNATEFEDPSEMGPYVVSESTISIIANDDISLSIFSPASTEALPLVLLLPRFAGSYSEYSHFLAPLASHGFVVVGADVSPGGFTDPAEHDQKAENVISVIDWLLLDTDIAAQIDASKIAVLGHSLGGKLAFYAAALDTRIDLVIALDPQNGGGPPCFLGETAQGDCNDFPVAPNCQAESSGILHQMQAESLIFGAEDTILTPDSHHWAREFYRGSPSPTHFISMPDVGHVAWSIDNDESTLSRGVYTAFLLSRFHGINGLEDWLMSGSVLSESSFVDEIRSK